MERAISQARKANLALFLSTVASQASLHARRGLMLKGVSIKTALVGLASALPRSLLRLMDAGNGARRLSELLISPGGRLRRRA